jgi:hypothetical protein
LTIQAAFPNDAPEKTAETAMIGETGMTEEAATTGEADWIAGVMKRGESDRLAEERTESAAVARIAGTL